MRLEDDDGSHSGATIDDSMLLILSGMKTDGNIVPPPTMHCEKRQLGGHDVAVVTVVPSDSPPVRFKGVIHVRSGPRRDIATAQDEQILNERRRYGNRPFDITPVPDTGSCDLNLRVFIDEYLPNAVDRESILQNDRTNIQRLAAHMARSPGRTSRSRESRTTGIPTSRRP